jgi:hypothetical protein
VRYLMLEFSFSAPPIEIEPSIEAQRAVLDAARLIDLKLKTAGIPALHGHVWPGFPVYVYVHTALSNDQLDDLFPRVTTLPKVTRVYEYTPTEEYKPGLTFKQAFEAQTGCR